MDILIKSFNRPYCLDRCIYSIKKFATNFNGKIVILDDGTPKKYLNKIHEKYPEVIIKTSEFYEFKSKKIELRESLEEYNKIPVKLWSSEANLATDYFLLLEDDMWFTSKIDFNSFDEYLTQGQIQLIKLLWIGNETTFSTAVILAKSNELIIYKSHFLISNPYLYKLVFASYKFNINKLFKALKINTLKRELQYYAVYSVAGAIFKKEYYAKLWDVDNQQVNEKEQIRKALVAASDFNLFGRTTKESLKTSFLSSATNSDKSFRNNDLDMFVFNRILNDAWLNDTFITTTDLDKDLNEDAIKTLLDNEKSSSTLFDAWQKWVDAFKNQYLSIGCKIE